MPSSHDNFERALCLILPFNILEVHLVAASLLQQLLPVHTPSTESIVSCRSAIPEHFALRAQIV
jgi:hypothetical protein